MVNLDTPESRHALACRYPLAHSGWPGTTATQVYFIVEDLDVLWTDGVPEILDCQSVDIVVIL